MDGRKRGCWRTLRPRLHRWVCCDVLPCWVKLALLSAPSTAKVADFKSGVAFKSRYTSPPSRAKTGML